MASPGPGRTAVYTDAMSKHPYLLSFLAAAAVFAWVHAVPAFGDPDVDYHLEMTRRTMAAGAVTAFPWLPYTTLADRFADHHFLYHVALAPFLAVFGDFLGLKIATVAFAALAMAALAFMLKEYGVRQPFLWTLPMLFAPGLVFRLALTKASAPALAALLLFMVALRRRSRGAAFGIAFAYVWLHGGWPILLVAAAIDAAVRRSWTTLWPTAAGLAAGLIANPFFPSNLSFYWEQIVQVALVGRADPAVVVGAEWYPAELGALLLENAAVFLPLVAALAALAASVLGGLKPRHDARPDAARKRDIAVVAAFVAVLMLMAIRQARHKEYFLPLALALVALVSERIFAAVDARALLSRAEAAFGAAARPVAAACASALLVFAAWALWTPHRLFASRPSWTRYQAAGAWLSANLAAGETVFHGRWDDFPTLWAHAPEQRYIAGLDALFMYRKDPAKYWLWRDIAEGRRRQGLADLIVREFGARVVLLRMDPDPLRPLMKKDPSFERVFADREAEIWRIRD